MNTHINSTSLEALNVYVLSLKFILPYNISFLKFWWVVNGCFYLQHARLLTHSTLRLLSFWQKSFEEDADFKRQTYFAVCAWEAGNELFCAMNQDDLVYLNPVKSRGEKFRCFHCRTLLLHKGLILTQPALCQVSAVVLTFTVAPVLKLGYTSLDKMKDVI